MRYALFIASLWLLPLSLHSQESPFPPVTEGLVAYYSFDNCDATDDTGGGSDGVVLGTPGCVCGVSGNALEFDGLSDHVLFLGFINNYFDTDNLSVSFYFKPFGSPLEQSIISKRESCSTDHAFEIKYKPTQNAVFADLSENSSKKTLTKATLDFSNCWHHVVFVRKGGRAMLYIDGEFVSEQTPTPNSRIDLDNNAVFSLAENPCIGGGTNRFKGYIDELAIYSVDLTPTKIRQLYLNPDKILSPDQAVYLGESLQVETSPTCTSDFTWSPTTGIDDPNSSNPTITPTETTTYRVEFRDENDCVAHDTIHLKVIDPATLDCGEVLFPKAFTPNSAGPLVNETFGISNRPALDALVRFEIFDRWGERVFYTEDITGRWDGTFQGEELNPGVFLYKVEYECNGNTQQQFGSLVLLR